MDRNEVLIKLYEGGKPPGAHNSGGPRRTSAEVLEEVSGASDDVLKGLRAEGLLDGLGTDEVPLRLTEAGKKEAQYLIRERDNPSQPAPVDEPGPAHPNASPSAPVNTSDDHA